MDTPTPTPNLINMDKDPKDSNKDIISKLKKFSTNKIDYFSHAQKVIGLWPIKPKHILTWYEGDYYPTVDDIPKMDRERKIAVNNYLKNESKCKDELDIQTRWSAERNIMWVTCKDEFIVNAIFRR